MLKYEVIPAQRKARLREQKKAGAESARTLPKPMFLSTSARCEKLIKSHNYGANCITSVNSRQHARSTSILLLNEVLLLQHSYLQQQHSTMC